MSRASPRPVIHACDVILLSSLSLRVSPFQTEKGYRGVPITPAKRYPSLLSRYLSDAERASLHLRYNVVTPSCQKFSRSNNR